MERSQGPQDKWTGRLGAQLATERSQLIGQISAAPSVADWVSLICRLFRGPEMHRYALAGQARGG